MTPNGSEQQEMQARYVTIGDARWDRNTEQLTVRGEPVKLTRRAAAAFSLLVEARGGVVTREEFQLQVWGTVQMDYSVVSQCIKTLRRALDPAPGGDSYIETVARAGYRLAVEVVEDVESAAPAPALPLPETPRPRRPWWIWLAAALGAILLAGGGAYAYKAAERRQQATILAERGLHVLRRGSINAGAQATSLFRDALTLVPDLPLANAGMAETASRMGNFAFENALQLAQRAAAADPRCSECQSILGQILGVRMWRWQEAEKHLRRAIELNSGNASHRIVLAEWLMVHGRLDDASREAEEATRLDPATPRAWTILAAVRYFQERYPEAIRAAEHSASLDPQHPSAPIWLYHSHMRIGEDQNAVIGRAKTMAAYSSTDPMRAYNDSAGRFFDILNKSGRRGLAEFWIKEVEIGRAREIHRYNRALWQAWIGEYDQALAELEAGVKSRPYQMIYTAVDPAFASLRSNPRFQQVVRDIGLAR